MHNTSPLNLALLCFNLPCLALLCLALPLLEKDLSDLSWLSRLSVCHGVMHAPMMRIEDKNQAPKPKPKHKHKPKSEYDGAR